MAEINSQFNFIEDQEMETQPIYLSSNESEIASLRSSPTLQLPINVPDTYSAITQLIAAQHEQMSQSNHFALQNPPTPPTSLLSDDEMMKCSPQYLAIPLKSYPIPRIAAPNLFNYASK